MTTHENPAMQEPRLFQIDAEVYDPLFDLTIFLRPISVELPLDKVVMSFALENAITNARLRAAVLQHLEAEWDGCQFEIPDDLVNLNGQKVKINVILE